MSNESSGDSSQLLLSAIRPWVPAVFTCLEPFGTLSWACACSARWPEIDLLVALVSFFFVVQFDLSGGGAVFCIDETFVEQVHSAPRSGSLRAQLWCRERAGQRLCSTKPQAVAQGI
jgi:hypothetical protein